MTTSVIDKGIRRTPCVRDFYRSMITASTGALSTHWSPTLALASTHARILSAALFLRPHFEAVYQTFVLIGLFYLINQDIERDRIIP